MSTSLYIKTSVSLGILLILITSILSPHLFAFSDMDLLNEHSKQSLGYVIITTQEILNKSKNIKNFKEHLSSRGFTVILITEKDYGYAEGQERALNIRNWLKENYKRLNIIYALLIGNPDPDDPTNPSDSYGDVPMFMAWPYKTEKGVPTDFFYADLTGNCDLDNDGLIGEYPDDMGEGGFDLKSEIYVGRIPVYNNDIDALDNILERIMKRDDSPKRMLLTLGIMNYNLENHLIWQRTDGSYLPSYLGKELGKEWTITGLYEAEGLEPSNGLEHYTKALNTKNFIEEWNKGYGLVFWLSHGNSESLFRKVWINDDGDGIPEDTEIEYILYLNLSDIEDSLKPSQTFVFGLSCFSGMPETPYNLQYFLLKCSALGVVGATREAWYSYGTWMPSGEADAIEIAYKFLLHMSRGYTSGIALYRAKNEVSIKENPFWLANIYTLNLYGDPSQGIYKDSLTIFIRVPQDFVSITEALTNAMPGTVILVDNGTYYENIEISGGALSNIKIISKYGPRGSTIIANNAQSVVRVFNAMDVVLKGFKIVGNWGFSILQSKNVLLEGNVILSSEIPMLVRKSDNIILKENNFVNNKDFSHYAMSFFWKSNHIKILNNTFQGTILHFSITCNNKISHNTLLDSGLIFSSTLNNAIEENNVEGFPIKYVENAADLTISGVYGEIIIVNSKNIDINNVTLYGPIGLSITNVTSISILSMEISGAYIGGIIQNSTELRILDSYIKNSSVGLYLRNVTDVEILKNTFENNSIALNVLDSQGLWIYLTNFIKNDENAFITNASCNFESPTEISYYIGATKLESFLGNFWSEFNAEDKDGDAILDSSYSITKGILDNHPLKYAFEFYLNRPPFALFDYYPQNITIFDKVTFNASISYDPDGKIVKYEWYIDEKPVSNDVTLTYRFIYPGKHFIELRVYDNFGVVSKYEITIFAGISAHDAIILGIIFVVILIFLFKIIRTRSIKRT